VCDEVSNKAFGKIVFILWTSCGRTTFLEKMEECLDWINERINHDMIGEDEKMNFQAFSDVLQNSDVFENHGGRYLLKRNGEVGRNFWFPSRYVFW